MPRLETLLEPPENGGPQFSLNCNVELPIATRRSVGMGRFLNCCIPTKEDYEETSCFSICFEIRQTMAEKDCSVMKQQTSCVVAGSNKRQRH